MTSTLLLFGAVAMRNILHVLAKPDMRAQSDNSCCLQRESPRMNSIGMLTKKTSGAIEPPGFRYSVQTEMFWCRWHEAGDSRRNTSS